MSDLTPAEQALRDNAVQGSDGRWSFASGYPHSEREALSIAQACLILGVPVTDMVTSRAWLVLIERMALLEARVARLEGSAGSA